MKRRWAASAFAIAIVIFAASSWAQGQATSMKIRFDFFAQGRDLPPGVYSFDVTPAGHVLLHSEKTGAEIDLNPIKSLGQNSSIKEPKLVFDKVGSVRFLSEVWLPGQEGYLVGSATGDREQEVVGVARAKK